MALGEIADQRALQALTAALKDEDPSVRRAAIQAIAEISDGGGGHGFRFSGSHPHPTPHPNPNPNPHPNPHPNPRPGGSAMQER
jgi:hypothetical protein